MSRESRRKKKDTDRDLVSSLAHGLEVLEAVAGHKEDIPLSELAGLVGLKKTSTWRLVHTLLKLGYVRQDAKTRQFRPAPRVLALGYAYFGSLDLKQLAEPFLRELSARFDETVNLAVQDGDQLVYIERINTSHIVNINLHVGSRLPLYNTSIGRVLICEMPTAWLEAYMKRLEKDPQAAEFLRGGERALPRLLWSTRKMGYSVNDEDLVKGLRGIASPIRDSSGEIIAAINISIPSSRSSITNLRRTCVPDLIATAEKISMALGYQKK